jgi:putative ABC transport system ATP-binding protein
MIIDPHASAVSVRRLRHWYGKGDLKREVLKDVSIEIEPGKATFLMGQSGCGKTTLLTLVGGLRSVMDGSITVLGRELAGASERTLVEARRDTGFVFQHHNLHRSLTLLGNVMMGLEVKGQSGRPDARDRCMAMLEAVGIADHAKKRQDEVTGGLHADSETLARQKAALTRHPQRPRPIR